MLAGKRANGEEALFGLLGDRESWVHQVAVRCEVKGAEQKGKERYT